MIIQSRHCNAMTQWWQVETQHVDSLSKRSRKRLLKRLLMTHIKVSLKHWPSGYLHVQFRGLVPLDWMDQPCDLFLQEGSLPTCLFQSTESEIEVKFTTDKDQPVFVDSFEFTLVPNTPVHYAPWRRYMTGALLLGIPLFLLLCRYATRSRM